jgi:hypothetical protein
MSSKNSRNGGSASSPILNGPYQQPALHYATTPKDKLNLVGSATDGGEAAASTFEHLNGVEDHTKAEIDKTAWDVIKLIAALPEDFFPEVRVDLIAEHREGLIDDER